MKEYIEYLWAQQTISAEDWSRIDLRSIQGGMQDNLRTLMTAMTIPRLKSLKGLVASYITDIKTGSERRCHQSKTENKGALP